MSQVLAPKTVDHQNYFFFAALTLAQRAFAAARILAIPAAEMWRFRRAGPGATFALTLAQRAFCAAEMRRRAAADIVRPLDGCGVLPFNDASAAIALSNRSRSCRSSLSTASRFAMRGIVALLHRELCTTLHRLNPGVHRYCTTFNANSLFLHI
jgi:hypothetical protein